MKVIKCKAVSIERKWVFGYAVVFNEKQFIQANDGLRVEIIPDTVCYSIEQADMNGRNLFIGDIVNDFGGGLLVPDTEHPDYHPGQAFPPYKQTGDTTRLGTIILEEGTIRIETSAMSYAYNISKGSRLDSMEYIGNQYDSLIKE